MDLFILTLVAGLAIIGGIVLITIYILSTYFKNSAKRKVFLLGVMANVYFAFMVKDNFHEILTIDVGLAYALALIAGITIALNTAEIVQFIAQKAVMSVVRARK